MCMNICDEVVILCSSFDSFLLFYGISDAAPTSSERKLRSGVIRHVLNIGKAKKFQTWQ